MNYLYLIGCLILGMIFYHFLKGFCGCKVVEGIENGGNGLEVDNVQSADDCLKKNNNYSGPNKSNLFDDNEETLTRNEKTDFANKIYRILKDVPLTDIYEVSELSVNITEDNKRSKCNTSNKNLLDEWVNLSTKIVDNPIVKKYMNKQDNLNNLDNLNISPGDINNIKNNIKNELNTDFTIDNKTIKNAIRYKNELHCPIISSLNSEASNVCGPSGTGVNIAKCIQSNDIQTCSPNNKVDKYCGQADYHIYCIDDDGNSISYEGKSYKEGKCSMYKWENNNCYKFDDS